MNNTLFLPQHSLADFIEASCQQYAELPAYTCLGQTLTFADIEQKSRALAAWLQHKSGLKSGDRVIIQLPNLMQYPIAAYAILRAGMVIVNTNPLYTTREMQHQFKDASAKAIIILSGLLPKLEAIIDNTAIETVIVTAATDLLTGDLLAFPTQGEQYYGFNQILAAGESLALTPRNQVALDDTCVLQYTGGTTGVSKGACLSHGNILSVTEQILERLSTQITPSQEILACPLPLYHIYAFSVNMMTFFSQGDHSVLIPNPRDLDAFVKAIQPYKITGMAGINTLFVSLCQHDAFKKLDFSQLSLTISGGSTLTSAAAELWKGTTDCTITEGYGLSESSAVVCLNQPTKEHLGAVGKPTLATTLQLWNEAGEQVADGQSGEVVVRGPQMLKAYWNMPKESAEAITSDGFFKTGDIGIRLPDGCIKIVDRLKDMIIVSGFNVYPNEIEEVLTSHESIMEAAVIGEEDEKTGERVCAYITVNGEIEETTLIRFCREQLTGYKVPKKIVVLDELPKSTVGKILRRELRD